MKKALICLKAYFWFKKAAYNGNLEAKELLDNDSD